MVNSKHDEYLEWTFANSEYLKDALEIEIGKDRDFLA